MLLTILSMLGGGFMRMLPEVMGFLNKKTDNKHELDMLDRQYQLEATRAAARRDEIMTQGDIDMGLAHMQAQAVAAKAQMQKTGLKWVDALNFLVRPLTTYFFLLMYAVVKLATLVVALRMTEPWTAIIQCWSADDMAILSGILAFWFVGRCFDKR